MLSAVMMMMMMMMMLVLLRLQMLGVPAGVMRALLPTLLVLILGCTGMAMRGSGSSLRISGSPIAQLVVLPGTPMAESHLAATSAGPSRSRTTTTTGRVARRGKVRTYVQAKSANVAHVGGLGGIGGMERLTGKGHVAGIAVGAITDVLGGVHPTTVTTVTTTASC